MSHIRVSYFSIFIHPIHFPFGVSASILVKSPGYYYSVCCACSCSNAYISWVFFSYVLKSVLSISIYYHYFNLLSLFSLGYRLCSIFSVQLSTKDFLYPFMFSCYYHCALPIVVVHCTVFPSPFSYFIHICQQFLILHPVCVFQILPLYQFSFVLVFELRICFFVMVLRMYVSYLSHLTHVVILFCAPLFPFSFPVSVFPVLLSQYSCIPWDYIRTMVSPTVWPKR